MFNCQNQAIKICPKFSVKVRDPLWLFWQNYVPIHSFVILSGFPSSNKKYFQFVGTFSVDVDVLARKSQSIQNNLSVLRVNTNN